MSRGRKCDFVGFWARGMKLHMYNRHNIFVEQDEVGERYKCKDKNLIENVGKKERKGAIIRPENFAINAGLKINGDLRGDKHTVWDGGFKIPFIVKLNQAQNH